MSFKSPEQLAQLLYKASRSIGPRCSLL